MNHEKRLSQKMNLDLDHSYEETKKKRLKEKQGS